MDCAAVCRIADMRAVAVEIAYYAADVADGNFFASGPLSGELLNKLSIVSSARRRYVAAVVLRRIYGAVPSQVAGYAADVVRARDVVF